MAETNIRKNAQGYGYTYTDLAEIHNFLESINAKYIQQIETVDGVDYVLTKRCFNDKWESEWIRGCRVVQATLSGKSNPAQEQGSALTYARRYSVLMAFGLATTDDDAQLLTKETKEIPKPKNKPKKTDSTGLSYRDKVLELAKERHIDPKELAKDYGLDGNTSEERFAEVLRDMEG